ncbi:MAG: histidinol-phosphate transaminase [Clostridiales bacterium]|nr:histidinol-phosphate transaminase [Clostridiales bacterium]
MPFELNEKLKNIEPYAPISGEYRIRLDANESFISLSDEVCDAISQRIESLKFNRYPDPFATELCSLFAKFYGIKSELVTAGNGSDELISVIMSGFLQKGDCVICLSPDFSMYEFYSHIVESNCIVVRKRDDFTVDIDEVISNANESNARMIIFSNPCNPTSIGIKREDVIKLIKRVSSLVVLDEAYMDFYDQSLINEVEQYDNLIILRTCSKALGMAAIRLGFAISNKKLTYTIRCVKSPYNVNSVTQAIGCAVFSNPDYIRRSIERIKTSRENLVEEMKKLEKNYPQELKIIANSANFVYTRFHKAEDLFHFLMNEGIIVRRFGDYLRITAGRNYENSELIFAIDKFLSGGETL